MRGATSTAADNDDGRFFVRLFYAFVALAVMSLAINFVGKKIGYSIAMAGYSNDQTVRRIVIGSNELEFPANMIRFENERRDGVASRIDLYLRWPDMQGYTYAARNDFNNFHRKKWILFLTIRERDMSRDMSGRFEPIYKELIEEPGMPGPNGLTTHRFRKESGYIGEELIVAPRADKATPFVARCLDEEAASGSLAACERDIQFGDNLQLLYRFPRELMGDWQAIDAAVAQFAQLHLVSN